MRRENEFIEEIIQDSLVKIGEIVDKANLKLSNTLFFPCPFKEGDIIKSERESGYSFFNGVSNIYRIESTTPMDCDYLTLKFERINQKKRYFIEKNDGGMCYVLNVSILLKSDRWSKNTKSIYYHQNDDHISVLKDNLVDVKHIRNASFQKYKISPLCIADTISKIDDIIETITSKRYEEAFSRYCKSSMIPKSAIEKDPKILELHQKIELLKGFKTKVNLSI